MYQNLARGGDRAREIKNLHIKAVALRYLTLLLDHPLLVDYEGLRIRVPEPAVFALHKLIVSQERQKLEKQKNDLKMAIELLDFLSSNPNEVFRVKKILDGLPPKWQKMIRLTYEKNYSAFGQRFLNKELPQIYISCPSCGQPMVYIGGVDYHCEKCSGPIGKIHSF